MFRKIFNLLFNDRLLGVSRSSDWPKVQKEFLKENPTCAVCGTKGKLLNKLNVHHIMPYHVDSIRELDKTNLITLCREHHFLFGHLLNWKSSNPDVVKDSKNMLNKILNRI